MIGRIATYHASKYLLRNTLMGQFIGLHCKSTILFVYVNIIINMY